MAVSKYGTWKCSEGEAQRGGEGQQVFVGQNEVFDD
jgi:hypothetical protein